MLKNALKALGKSVLIVTGVGYGVVKALHAFASVPPEAAPASPGRSEPENNVEATMRRLDCVDERLIRIGKSLEALVVPPPREESGRGGVPFVTREELTAAMERFSRSVNDDIDRRFEVQNRSVQSLRTMVARTDELLEQVLESIESTDIHV